MSSPPYIRTPSRVSLVIILPDYNAITIFRRLCFALRMADPDLPEVFRNPEIVFLPVGGPTGRDQSEFSPLLPTLTILERRGANGRESDWIVDGVLRGMSRFVLVTKKASFFNYLSTRAIQDTLGVQVDVTDQADVPVLVAQALQRRRGEGWDELGDTERERLVGYAANTLADRVAPAMTPDLLLERRAKADVGHWLKAVKRLLPY